MSTYKQIGSAVTVGAGGAATISFTSIPNTYTDLVIKISGSDNRSGQALDDIKIRVNSNTSAIYTTKRLTGFPSVGIYSDGAASTSDAAVGWVNGPTATANTFANTEIYLPNYASNVAKTGSIDGVSENNATLNGLVMNVLIIDTTSPISSIQLSPFSTAATAFNQHTTAYLYGISNA